MKIKLFFFTQEREEDKMGQLGKRKKGNNFDGKKTEPTVLWDRPKFERGPMRSTWPTYHQTGELRGI